VSCPSEKALSPRAAILFVVGVLNGSRFSGGRRRGCRFFLMGFVFSISEIGGTTLRSLGSRSSFNGSRIDTLPDRLFVEVLLILLASKGKLDFRLVKNGCSFGESLGDS
jgi:hypothetical protein